LTLEELSEVWARSAPEFISHEIHHKVPAFWKRTPRNAKVMTPYFFKKYVFFQKGAVRPATIQAPPINSYGTDLNRDVRVNKNVEA
jgi:hypothetical protein